MSFEAAANKKAIEIGKLSVEMTTAAGMMLKKMAPNIAPGPQGKDSPISEKIRPTNPLIGARKNSAFNPKYTLTEPATINATAGAMIKLKLPCNGFPGDMVGRAGTAGAWP